MSYELKHVLDRKNYSDSTEKPETSLIKKVFDKASYVVAVIGPLSSIDQIIQIFIQKSADGVSIVVWTVLLFTSIFWIFYGAIHRETVILFGHTLWLTLCSIILFEIIIFS